MVCPNCSSEMSSGNRCPHCRLDTVLFSGTVRISDNLYNKGLAKIKSGDLSGGIECLTKSVEINKNNLHARNLLGLTLYEIGRVGEALKHWVISQSLVKDDNPAAAYMDSLQNNGRVLERMNDAVRMYNRALADLKQKSDDMAAIQLKKAVEINPKFIDAMNLLALCYLIQRDKVKAGQMVERVLALDVNNTVALNYYEELYPGRARLEARPRKQAVSPSAALAVSQPTYTRMTVREKKSNNFHIAEIVSFIIGAGCMLGVLYVLILPAIYRENEKTVSDYQQQLAAAEQRHNIAIAEKSEIITQRDQQILALEGEAEKLAAANDVQERTNQVLNAYSLFVEDKLQEAVDIVTELDTYGLAADIKEKAESVITVSYPKLAQEYYDQGVRAYSRDRDYDKAQVDLEKALRYIDEEASYMPDLMYYLGYTYTMNEDNWEKAKEVLTALTEDYPNYRRIREVKQKLSSLE